MTFDELPEFKKDLKILLKKFRTLYEDLIVVKKVLEILPDEKAEAELEAGIKLT